MLMIIKSEARRLGVTLGILLGISIAAPISLILLPFLSNFVAKTFLVIPAMLCGCVLAAAQWHPLGKKHIWAFWTHRPSPIKHFLVPHILAGTIGLLFFFFLPMLICLLWLENFLGQALFGYVFGLSSMLLGVAFMAYLVTTAIIVSPNKLLIIFCLPFFIFTSLNIDNIFYVCVGFAGLILLLPSIVCNVKANRASAPCHALPFVSLALLFTLSVELTLTLLSGNVGQRGQLANNHTHIASSTTPPQSIISHSVATLPQDESLYWWFESLSSGHTTVVPITGNMQLNPWYQSDIMPLPTLKFDNTAFQFDSDDGVFLSTQQDTDYALGKLGRRPYSELTKEDRFSTTSKVIETPLGNIVYDQPFLYGFNPEIGVFRAILKLSSNENLIQAGAFNESYFVITTTRLAFIDKENTYFEEEDIRPTQTLTFKGSERPTLLEIRESPGTTLVGVQLAQGKTGDHHVVLASKKLTGMDVINRSVLPDKRNDLTTNWLSTFVPGHWVYDHGIQVDGQYRAYSAPDRFNTPLFFISVFIGCVTGYIVCRYLRWNRRYITTTVVYLLCSSMGAIAAIFTLLYFRQTLIEKVTLASLRAKPKRQTPPLTSQEFT